MCKRPLRILKYAVKTSASDVGEILTSGTGGGAGDGERGVRIVALAGSFDGLGDTLYQRQTFFCCAGRHVWNCPSVE